MSETIDGARPAPRRAKALQEQGFDGVVQTTRTPNITPARARLKALLAAAAVAAHDAAMLALLLVIVWGVMR